MNPNDNTAAVAVARLVVQAAGNFHGDGRSLVDAVRSAINAYGLDHEQLADVVELQSAVIAKLMVRAGLARTPSDLEERRQTAAKEAVRGLVDAAANWLDGDTFHAATGVYLRRGDDRDLGREELADVAARLAGVLAIALDHGGGAAVQWVRDRYPAAGPGDS